MARKDDEQWKALNKRLRQKSPTARKDDERWEALRQAAFDYVKAFNAAQLLHFRTVAVFDGDDDDDDDDYDEPLAHAEAVLKAEAERFRRRSEMKKAGA